MECLLETLTSSLIHSVTPMKMSNGITTLFLESVKKKSKNVERVVVIVVDVVVDVVVVDVVVC